MKGKLDEKTSYQFWTFGGKVPGPFIRARLGDTLEIHLRNDATSILAHSVDFHGALGPGGGSQFTQTFPGEEKVFSFKTTIPGLFVYHCATPSIASSFHIVGEIFDSVRMGGGRPMKEEQTVLVAPGNAATFELQMKHAGHFNLIDHALSRVERGLNGVLVVDGPEEDDLMHAGPAAREPKGRRGRE
ncbi:multicopper oxidase domain-containing protein [Methylocystis echinoides]|uniref:multicopper oxidase domain-containing protein n=1 Tax=Methylocystis echinoides TaxID=29468 RepID=UPI0024914F7B|nr:multicopper oxidase domain-containing protein [Methylocystis echinoides]